MRSYGCIKHTCGTTSWSKTLNPVLDINYVRDEKLKKYLFTFKDNKKNKIFALKPDLSLMSLIEFSKKKTNKKKKFSIQVKPIEKI